MKWLKPSVLAFILFIFAVNGVESIPVAVQSTIAITDVTRIDTSATVTAKKVVFRAKRADFSEVKETLREVNKVIFEDLQREYEYEKSKLDPKFYAMLYDESEPWETRYLNYVKARQDRTLNIYKKEATTRKPWQPATYVNAIKVPIRTTTEETTTTTKKHKPTTKVDHAAQIRKDYESVTIESEPSSNKYLYANLAVMGVSWALVILMVCGAIIFGVYMRTRRIRLIEEMDQNRLRNPQMGYNLNPQPNMTPARTATATPTSAISRTSNELSNEKTNN